MSMIWPRGLLPWVLRPETGSVSGAPNCAEWVLTQFATARAGIILVNINPAYRTHELEFALNKVSCKGLVTASRFKSSDYLAMLTGLAPELISSGPGQLSSRRLPHLKTVIRLGEGQTPGCYNFDALPAMAGSTCNPMTPSIYSSPAARPGRPRALP